MTLVNHKQIGRHEGRCYEEIVEDLGLHDEFKYITGQHIEDYELDPTKITEDELIHRLVEMADEEFILYSDVIGLDERMYYSILKVD